MPPIRRRESTELGDGRPRRMRTRRPAGIRRSRKCAGAKRRVDSAKPNPKGAQASTCAAPPAALWLSADRMCWAGNAAAVSRTRAGRWDAWQWTRPRRQSGDCRAGRGRSQAPSATGGRGCGGIPRILTYTPQHTLHTCAHLCHTVTQCPVSAARKIRRTTSHRREVPASKARGGRRPSCPRTPRDARSTIHSCARAHPCWRSAA